MTTKNKPEPTHDRSGAAVWNVHRVAVDEPAEGESGTIYEYEVRFGDRVVFTTYNEADARDAVAAQRAVPDLIRSMRVLLYDLDQRCAAHSPKSKCRVCFDREDARAVIRRHTGGR